MADNSIKLHSAVESAQAAGSGTGDTQSVHGLLNIQAQQLGSTSGSAHDAAGAGQMPAGIVGCAHDSLASKTIDFFSPAFYDVPFYAIHHTKTQMDNPQPSSVSLFKSWNWLDEQTIFGCTPCS